MSQISGTSTVKKACLFLFFSGPRLNHEASKSRFAFLLRIFGNKRPLKGDEFLHLKIITPPPKTSDGSGMTATFDFRS